MKRLALVHEAAEIVEVSEDLEISYRPQKSFAVKSECSEANVEEELGKTLATEGNIVDLEDPDEVIKVYEIADNYCIARMIENIDRSLFEGRKNQERPFSSPISLDPVLARVLVNLSKVSAGDSVLDPFCGTGGILIESGLCGVDIHGLDVQQEMVEGTRENLETYGIIGYDIRQGEISEVDEIFDQGFDAIITDLPYGQASRKEGEPVEKFIEVAPELADKVVFMSDQKSLNGLEPEFSVYVHKNLTRYIYLID